MKERLKSFNVRFERPVMKELSDGGYAAVDMHIHTNHSDAPVKVKAAVKRAKNIGFGLAITDHNAIGGYKEAVDCNEGVLLIPGLEVSAREGPHILLYFYSPDEMEEYYARYIRDNRRKSPYMAIRLSTREILEGAEPYHCIAAAAHPYGYLIFNKGLQKCIDSEYLPEDLINAVQAVEAVSGGMPRSENIRAIHLAEMHGLGIVGGTDGHLLFDIGRVLTCSHAETPDEFLDNILKLENFIIGKEKHFLEKGLMGSIVLTRYVRYTLPSLAIHYEQNIPRIQRYFHRIRRKNRR